MAKLEFSKKKGKVKLSSIPSKKTMNFVHHVGSINPKRIIPVAVVLVILGGFFIKFGILDLVQKKIYAYNKLQEKQSQLSLAQSNIKDFDKVSNLFGRYSYGWMTDEEVNLVNRLLVIGLVDSKISKVASVDNYSIDGNALTVNVHGITLDEAGEVVRDLETSDLVKSAIVYNAVAEEAEEATIYMSIMLQNGEAIQNEEN